MERLSVHQKNTKPAAKAKKKPIKVVYISNPMKVKASAAEFRDLVQELTGRDSNVAYLSRLPDAEDTGDPPPAPESSSGAAAGPSPAANRSSNPCDNALRSAANSDLFEMFDETFNPQMMENLQGFSPSPLYYGHGHQSQGFRDYDASCGEQG
ncbi:sigma factor binding protein 2, chloroplastic-like [Phoenix dactylifera]|uniref:Sigma factor binding protein 2, chloroplastic-like n=1 Tax=Phoenix dactylifera TaxID=42345 RepID=A0A8B7BZE6_PHODC|nr:sigma factor binding protein 2, chloroplastic-like [Phoenix dactylifera]